MARKQGWKHTEEAKLKMSKVHKGKKRSEKTRMAIAKANTGKDNSSRGPAISKALSQRLFNEYEWEILNKTKKLYPWLTNIKAFVKISEIEKYFGVLRKTRMRDIQIFLNPTLNQPKKMLPVKVQMWSREKIDEFKNDYNNNLIRWNPEKYYFEKYGLNKKMYFSTVEAILGVKINVFPGEYALKYGTSIELFVMRILDELKVHYVFQKYVNNNKWRVDFLVNNIFVIETNGTYHHADPRVYREIDHDKIQKFNVARDNEKITWLKKNGFQVLEIWQKDIEERPEWVFNSLIKYLEGVTNVNKKQRSVFIQSRIWD